MLTLTLRHFAVSQIMSFNRTMLATAGVRRQQLPARASFALKFMLAPTLALLTVAAYAQSPFLLNPTQLKSGAAHTCALTSAGGVKCWGLNNTGQLGDGTFEIRTRAVDVVGLSSGVTAISTYWNHTCALLANGSAKCWGENIFGQLGDGTTTASATPVAVAVLSTGVTSISVSDTHSCAVVSGSVKCWGFNTDGQLGNNSTVSSSTPVNVIGSANDTVMVATGGYFKRGPPIPRDLTPSYGNHTCALSTAGTVKCWGSNVNGQLGFAGPTGSTTAQTVAGATNAVELVSGAGHSCIRSAAGGVKCWGMIEYTRITFSLGGPRLFSTTSNSPIDITGLTSGASSLSVQYDRTCTSTTAGVQCWGGNLMLAGDSINGYSNITPPGGNPQIAHEYDNTSTTAYTRNSFVAQNGRTRSFGGALAGDGTRAPREAPVDVLTISVFSRVSTHQNYQNGTAYFSGETSDIIFSDSPGSLSLAIMGGLGSISVPLLAAGSGWTGIHQGDFNGDGRMEIVARHNDGTTVIFKSNQLSFSEATPLLGAGSGYDVTLLGDFDGDSKADLVLTRNDGSVAIVLMDGGNVKSATQLLPPGTPWRVVKAGDFNADGNSDLIIDRADGTTAILMMNGTTVVKADFLLTAGSGWSVTHVADFNSDFKADIIVRNTNGATALLQMNDTSVAAAVFLTNASSPWTVAQVGDFNGDGRKDVLLRSTSGEFAILQMNGLVVDVAAYLPAQPANATVAQIGDYNGDGKEDILLRNADGSFTVLLINGTMVAASGTLSFSGTLVPVPY